MIQDLSGSWCMKGTGESTLVMDPRVPLMHHDPDRSWITDRDLDHPKGTQPKTAFHRQQRNLSVFICDLERVNEFLRLNSHVRFSSNRPFSLSHNKKMNRKPSSGKS